MTFNQLRYFIKVVQYNSINKAAKELYLTPSALLTALKKLEDELGFSLFIRSKSGVHLTADGELFFSDAKTILDISETWSKIPERSAFRNQVDIKLAVIPSVYGSVLSEIILEVKKEYKEINLIPIESMQPIDKEILPGVCHCAIISSLLPEKKNLLNVLQNLNLDYRTLYHEHYLVYVGKKNALFQQEYCTASQLKQFSGVSFPYKSSLKFDYRKFYDMRNTIFLEKMSTILQKLSESGEYFAILPSIVCRHVYCTTGLVKGLSLKDEYLPVDYILVYPKEDQITLEEKMVVETIINYFGQMSE